MRDFPVCSHLITAPFELLDALRRWQGALSDGLAPPRETAHRILLRRPGVTLRHYGSVLSRSAPLLLAIPAPIKGPTIWDLAPGVSAVRRCLDAGIQVCLMEWTNPGRDGADWGLAEYADRFISDSLQAIEAEGGGHRVTLIGLRSAARSRASSPRSIRSACALSCCSKRRCVSARVRACWRRRSPRCRGARKELPALLEAAERGRSTIITKRGRPVAALVPFDAYRLSGAQQPLTTLKGSGRDLWGKSSARTLRKLRGGWDR